MKDFLNKAFSNSIEKFKSRVFPVEWVPRGILMSEGFAVCAIADYITVDLIIESGIFNGKSTVIWSKYFSHSNVPVIAVDLVIREKAKENLKTFVDNKQLTVISGNGIELLPELIQQNTGKRIGLFIDGPKSYEAVDLAKVCFSLGSNVLFSAFHDSNKASTTRGYLEKWNVNKFYTDDEDFVKEYSFLDVDESKYDCEQNLQWTPYKILPDRSLGGSYGMTMCIAFNGIEGITNNV